MDKNAIKKYAVWARRELISRVSQRAALYEITDNGYGDASADSVLGRVMSAEEKRERQALIAQIREKGYELVMEEIAYTWFNRFIALRFMEVNGYLPSRVRVFTDEENNFKPQILAEAISMELDGLNMEKVYALKNANDDDALFKYMIIVQCNALSSILPGMFQRISDFTELLFPDNLLREGSVIEQMVSMIPENDWTDQVQIIGWLYQYYNTEPKDKVFADLKKNIKISKESIPAATQMFTPDWIVRYMVENSLGRIWLEGHPNDELKASWKYYLDEAEQEPDVQVQLSEIRKEYAALNPEDILAIDPCQGSGHILAYMFDVLVQIYEAYGYTAREAASSIVKNNIWGLDIDDRATQLAYFSVMMKARQYDRRFFSRGIQPNVYAIQESNNVDAHCVDYFVQGNEQLRKSLSILLAEMQNAKIYGSSLKITEVDFGQLFDRFEQINNEETPSLYSFQTVEVLLPIVRSAYALAQKYYVVVTNPPYMNSSGMEPALSDFIKQNYPMSKADMSTVMMEKAISMCKPNAYMAMINIPVWMTLVSFEKLRNNLLGNYHIVNMLHCGRGIFGSDFGTTAFVFRRAKLPAYSAQFRRLFEKAGDVEQVEAKERRFLTGAGKYISSTTNFSKIPGMPVAYWASEAFLKLFSNKSISDYAFPVEGIKSGDNETFLRFWQEIEAPKVGRIDHFEDGKTKWCFTTKGGAYRKWYGNIEYVIDWTGNGSKLKNTKGTSIYKELYWHMPAITWTYLTAGSVSFRALGNGMLYNNKGPAIFGTDYEKLLYICGLINSKVGSYVLSFICSTLTFLPGDMKKIPIIFSDMDSINQLVRHAIQISKDDWDSFETSWEFKTHPYIEMATLASNSGREITLKQAHDDWSKVAEKRFKDLKATEEELNEKFINIYGLSGELEIEIPPEDITVHQSDLQREIRSFISYAVGCMFGRYALVTPGLVYAGGKYDFSKYSEFYPDKDAIIPICDDEYFEDDIVGRFVSFVEKSFGKNSLEDNLKFIAEALGGKGVSREIIRNYFINDFYTDHLKVYQKRPIYWLFDSGKKNGFKCLVYMHRYQPDTIARIRTDYVHEQQSRYRTAIADLESRIANAGTGERVKLSKQLTKLQEQAEELRVYEEKIHHLADQMIRIDLDDGVKHNYAIFQDVLAKIK